MLRSGLRIPPPTMLRSFHPPYAHSAATRAATKQDRKSTRLNSSHSQISYAVFCLKKKKKTHCRWVGGRRRSRTSGDDQPAARCPCCWVLSLLAVVRHLSSCRPHCCAQSSFRCPLL